MSVEFWLSPAAIVEIAMVAGFGLLGGLFAKKVINTRRKNAAKKQEQKTDPKE